MTQAHTVFGLSFESHEPVGPQAIALYQSAIKAYTLAGCTMETEFEGIDQGLPEEVRQEAQGRSLLKAARMLAGCPEALPAVKATLAQVTHNGAPVVPQWDALWNKPGMYLSPYVIALRCWIEWGFLFDGAR